MLNDTTIRDLREIERRVEAHYTPEVWRKNSQAQSRYHEGEMWGGWRSGDAGWDPAYTLVLLGARDYYFDLIEPDGEPPHVVYQTRFLGQSPRLGKYTTVTTENITSLLPRLPNSDRMLNCLVRYGIFRATLTKIPDRVGRYIRKKFRQYTDFLYVPNTETMFKAMKLYYGEKTWMIVMLKGGLSTRPAEFQSSHGEITYENVFRINDTDITLGESCHRLWFQYRRSNGKYFTTSDLSWMELRRAVRDWQYKSYDKNWIRDILQISEKE